MKDTKKWAIPDPTHLIRRVQPLSPFILGTTVKTVFETKYLNSSDRNERLN